MAKKSSTTQLSFFDGGQPLRQPFPWEIYWTGWPTANRAEPLPTASCTDFDWQDIVGPGCDAGLVYRSVCANICDHLSAATAREVMERMTAYDRHDEPADRSRVMLANHSTPYKDSPLAQDEVSDRDAAWAKIHAFEDGWVSRIASGHLMMTKDTDELMAILRTIPYVPRSMR